MRLALLASFFLLVGGASAARGPINVTATLAHSHSRELGQPGRVTNSLQEQWRLADRYGRPVGEMLLACRWITARQRYCGGVIRMPLGDLTLQGSSPTRLSGLFAVTGGTEYYRAVRGQMRFTLIGLHKLVLYITVTTR